jgi:hypothetical protein
MPRNVTKALRAGTPDPPIGAADARCSMIVNAEQNGQIGAATADW